ncbi:Uncharacterised protein [Salmonella enterica subsp. enterica serovar Bovismorbificans]|uniref:Uncharacterized protein n=1 Tax=Salmonella enterica subsp. enterica serovar Bovismorbificans TaxID=58097 RepID=A0A655CC10_SALET|nr:Uncharacterised protein [Salmonella enterica subsp. enterica serovar Bovismorbificans]
MTTRPLANEITAQALPSCNQCPNCPLTADCIGESIPAKMVASISKGVEYLFLFIHQSLYFIKGVTFVTPLFFIFWR